MPKECRERPFFRHDDVTNVCITRQIDVTHVELGIRERLLQSLACTSPKTQALQKSDIFCKLMIALLNHMSCYEQDNKRYIQAIRYQHCIYLLEDGAKSPFQILHDLWLKPSLGRFM